MEKRMKEKKLWGEREELINEATRGKQFSMISISQSCKNSKERTCTDDKLDRDRESEI